MPNASPSRLVGTSAAARIACCSSETIRMWAGKGWLDVRVLTDSGRRYFDPDQVARVARERATRRVTTTTAALTA